MQGWFFFPAIIGSWIASIFCQPHLWKLIEVVMGLLGSLLGWDQSMGALNVVLASHLIEGCENETRRRIASMVDEIMVRSRVARRTMEERQEELSGDSRTIQMNFITLACGHLGIPPAVPGFIWSDIKNPNPYRIATQISDLHIYIAVDLVRKDTGIAIRWPGKDNHLDFRTMYRTGLLR